MIKWAKTYKNTSTSSANHDQLHRCAMCNARNKSIHFIQLGRHFKKEHDEGMLGMRPVKSVLLIYYLLIKPLASGNETCSAHWEGRGLLWDVLVVFVWGWVHLWAANRGLRRTLPVEDELSSRSSCRWRTTQLILTSSESDPESVITSLESKWRSASSESGET